MPDRDDFLRAICADPSDPGPRLIFADWLEERGEDGSAWRRGQPPRRLGYGSGDDGGGDDGGGYGSGDDGGGYGSGDDGGGYGSGYGSGDDGGGYGSGDDGGGYGSGDDGGGYGSGGGGYGSGDDGGGYGSGGGGGGNGGGSGRGGGQHPIEEIIMPAIGDTVLVHARGSFYPYVWCGKVVAIPGPGDYVLSPAILLPHTREQGSTWAGIAAGDKAMRREVRVRRYEHPVEVYDVCYCTPWVGDLPDRDQH